MSIIERKEPSRRISNIFLPLALVLSGFIFLAGCNQAGCHLERFNVYYESQDSEMAASFAEKKIRGKQRPASEDLLWSLQLGVVERDGGDYSKSTAVFDKAEDMLKYFDEQFDKADIIKTTAVNDNVIPYRGQQYDGIMINTYKALNFMAVGDDELARVEFNRALDRQRRAKEHFNKEIRKLKNELEENQKNDANLGSSINNPEIHKIINERYPNLDNFQAYPDFINPFTTYMAGLFFTLDGDHAKAIDLFRESVGMVEGSEYIKQDLALTENILDGRGELKDTVWVIFENGLGPVKEEARVDIPVFIASDNVRYAGIALPQLAFRLRAYPYLAVNAGGKTFNTEMICDMDRVIQTEFRKDFDGILQRAIISAAAKVVAQYALAEQDNSSKSALASTLMAIYTMATTTADVRIWTALPKEFQAARLPRPENGKIEIIPPGAMPFIIDIGSCNNAVVYIKIITNRSAPVWHVMKF